VHGQALRASEIPAEGGLGREPQRQRQRGAEQRPAKKIIYMAWSTEARTGHDVTRTWLT